MCWVHLPEDTVGWVHINWYVVFSVVFDDDINVFEWWVWCIRVEDVVCGCPGIVIVDPVGKIVERSFRKFDVIGQIFMVCGGGGWFVGVRLCRCCAVVLFFTDCFKSCRTVIMRLLARQCC